MKKDGLIRKKLFFYTVFFLGISFVMFAPIFVSEKTIMRIGGDNYTQYYSTFAYYRKWLIRLFGSLFSGGNPGISSWNMSLGYGADTLTTLNYYGVGDPLNILSVFVPESILPIGFTIITFLRLYLAGWFFILFVTNHGSEGKAAVLCGVWYAFSGYTMYYVTSFSEFGLSLLFAPLVLLAIDRIRSKKSGGVLVGIVAIGFISNFYLMYVVGVFAFTYFIVILVKSYLETRKYNHNAIGLFWRRERNFILKAVVSVIVGILLSMPVLFPSIKVMLENSRNVTEIENQLYPVIYYPNLFVHFFWGNSITLLGFSFLSFPILVKAFIKNWIYKVLICGSLLLLCFPFFSKALNGFTYVTDRWQWIVSFVVIFIIAKEWRTIFELSMKLKLITILAYVVLVALGILLSDYDALALIIISGIIVTLIMLNNSISNGRVMVGLITCVFASIVYSAHLMMNTTDTTVGKINYVDIARTDPWQTGYMALLDRAGYQRDDNSRVSFLENDDWSQKNVSLLGGICGTQFYYSLYSPYVAEFIQDMGIPFKKIFDYSGVDGRRTLLKLLNVKTVLSNSVNTKIIPGYPLVYQSGLGTVMEDSGELGFARTYDSYITSEVWSDLNAVEKEIALEQAVYLNDNEYLETRNQALVPLENMKQVSKEDIVSSNLEEGTIRIYSNGNELNNSSWKIDEPSNPIEIQVENRTKSGEMYLCFTGMDFEDTKNAYSNVVAKTEDVTCKDVIAGDLAEYYTGKTNKVFYFGYFDEIPNEISLEFDAIGEIKFESVSVLIRPANTICEKQEVFDLFISGDEMSINIDVESEKMLVIAVPYSEGWSLTDNGNKVEILRVDDMLMGVGLTRGKHALVWNYITPGLVEGIVLCIAGIIIVMVFAIANKKRIF